MTEEGYMHDFIGDDFAEWLGKNPQPYDGAQSLASWFNARAAMSDQAAADDEPHHED